MTTSSTQGSTQKDPVACNTTFEFIDEYRLLFTLEAEGGKSPALVIMDTKPDEKKRTTFRVSFPEATSERIFIQMEKGAHNRSKEETSLAPFYQDPGQRLITLTTHWASDILVFRVEALLKHHKGGENSEVQWNYWKESVATVTLLHHPVATWVSGCRLFILSNPQHGGEQMMRVYDFSREGQKFYQGDNVKHSRDGIKELVNVGERSFVPTFSNRVHGTGDSAISFTNNVSAPVSLFERELNETFCVAAGKGNTLNILTF